MTARQLADRWMLFALKSQTFGVEVDVVREVAALGATHRLVHAPAGVRGLFELRGKTALAIDLRKVLGMPGFLEEADALDEALRARRDEHVRWLEELASCVRDGRPFRLATDPTQCAFSRWYAGFEIDDPVVKLKLVAIDLPHRRIHALASRALGLVADGRQREAVALIDAARDGDLREVTRLLDELAVLIRAAAREVVLVCDVGGRTVGIVVDAVHEVRRIEPAQIARWDGDGLPPVARDWVTGVSHVGDRTTVLLAADRIAATMIAA